jgi:hypothetical protein
VVLNPNQVFNSTTEFKFSTASTHVTHRRHH